MQRLPLLTCTTPTCCSHSGCSGYDVDKQKLLHLDVVHPGQWRDVERGTLLKAYSGQVIPIGLGALVLQSPSPVCARGLSQWVHQLALRPQTSTGGCACWRRTRQRPHGISSPWCCDAPSLKCTVSFGILRRTHSTAGSREQHESLGLDMQHFISDLRLTPP